MKQPAAYVFSAAVLLSGCSDGTAPAAGQFGANLSGALGASLSGPSNASVIYAEEFPEPRFAIRMYDSHGDTLRSIGILCPGQEPPAPGSYRVSASVSDCQGSYLRLVSTQQSGTTVLEHAAASSGAVTILASDVGRSAGSFGFSGVLVAGTDSVGTLSISGTFDAVVIP